MNRVIVVDDDITQTVLIKTILTKFGYEVTTYNDPLFMLKEFRQGMTDIILSDIYMPVIGGLDLVKAAKKIDKNIPFIMFTSSKDIKTLIGHFNKGISDYLLKPIIPDDLVHRVHRVLEENKQSRSLMKIEQERDLIELENNKLNNWRNLYANKDIKQTKQMMLFFSRSINSGGGYVWLDILKDLGKEEDGSVILEKDLYELITQSASDQRKAFEYLTFINNLPDVSREHISLDTFSSKLSISYNEILLPMFNSSNRSVSLNLNLRNILGTLVIDTNLTLEIIEELCINSIKFSPEHSNIIIEVYKVNSEKLGIDSLSNKSKNWMLFQIRNEPKNNNATDDNHQPILGIPYDYVELVYDLFYTMESYPIEHPAEKWSNGTGLYIARNLVKKMKGWLECENMIDYTRGQSKPYVQFRLFLPVINDI